MTTDVLAVKFRTVMKTPIEHECRDGMTPQLHPFWRLLLLPVPPLLTAGVLFLADWLPINSELMALFALIMGTAGGVAIAVTTAALIPLVATPRASLMMKGVLMTAYLVLNIWILNERSGTSDNYFR